MRIRKEVVGYVQDMVGKNNLPFQFEDGQRRQMSDSSLSYVCYKEEFGKQANENISEPLKKEEGELLTTDGDPVDEADCMFE